MKRIIIAACLLWSASAAAQSISPAGGGGSPLGAAGGALSGTYPNPALASPLTIPSVGTSSNPGLVFTGSASYGFFLTGGVIQIGNSGTSYFGFSTNSAKGLAVSGAIPIGFTSAGTDGSNPDAIITRKGAANIQHGAADVNGAPVAQTVSFQSAITATDQAGANTIIIGSRATGAGANGNYVIEVGKTGTTGATQATAFPMLSVNAGTATTATIQLGDGSNFTTYDSCTALTTSATGVIQCTASAMRFKDSLGAIKTGIATDGLDMLRPAVWSYKPEFQQRFGHGVHVGLYADDVAKMDPRCAVYENGDIKNYEDRCVIAYLVATMQGMKAEIEGLKRGR